MPRPVDTKQATGMSEQLPIRYRVSADAAAAHVFNVRCVVETPDPRGQLFSLPGWIPGSYLVRDYARHVLSVCATAAGQPVAMTKTDKATWQAAPCEGPLEVACEVYAYDLSVRGAYLDTERGFFNGVCLFLAVEGASETPCEVCIEKPGALAGSTMAKWRVATAMSAVDTDDRGFGSYRAANYDELIDHPVEISNFRSAEFSLGGVPHQMVLAGRERADLERLRTDVPRICETHRQMFDDKLPMERYVFLTNVVGEGYGGLEHRASCALITRRSDLPQHGKTDIDKAYRRFLGLVSHEYFHLWNIKRIKPAAFTPFDLRSEAYTRLLWVFEGITSYYDDLALVRSGLIDTAAYLELLADNVSKVWQTPGRHRQSLAESSFDAWIKLYKPDENSPNTLISYYSKGLLIALALDLTIRQQTDGSKSLDDVMRELWRRYGKTGRGLEEGGFESLASEVSGVALQSFFDTAIRSTDDPPLATLLEGLGIKLTFSMATESLGGNGNSDKDAACVLGVRLREDCGRVLINTVLSGGPAAEAGLAGGDELVAIDGLKVTPSSFAGLMMSFRAGEKVAVQVFRRDELLEFSVTLSVPPAHKCQLSLADGAPAAAVARRAAWLWQ